MAAQEVAVEVPGQLDGERVDKALAVMLGLSRAHARSLIEEGVTVDGTPVKPGDRVSAGAIVVSGAPGEEPALRPEPVPFEVLYEDDALVVVDKPAGVVVHPGSGRTVGTLAAGLLHRYPGIEGVGSPGRWGLVHRLDKDTSGVMAVALTTQSHRALTDQIRGRQVLRTYTALVDGQPGAPTGTVDAPIGRDPVRPSRRTIIQGGRMARTHFEVERLYPGWGCSLLTVRLETGRTHQIRVHLSAIGHPVVGDPVYGSPQSRVRSPRTFLHASLLELAHPLSGEALRVEAPLPPDLRRVLETLEEDGEGTPVSGRPR